MMNIDKKYLIATSVILMFLLGSFLWHTFFKTSPTVTPSEIPSPKVLTQTTDIKVQPKTSPQDADLKLTDNYIAIINNKEVKIPIDTSEVSKDAHQATLVQTIDMTPIVKQMIPKWEAGASIDVINSDPYVGIHLKRNYNENSAVSLSVYTNNPTKIEGVGVTYWHRF